MSDKHIEVLPVVQEEFKEITPRKPHKVRFSNSSKYANPWQKVPLMFGHPCPDCGQAICVVRDGLCTYSVAIEDFPGPESILINVLRVHRCAGIQ